MQGNVSELSPEDREWFEDRAAILEFDAGLPRDEAERRAMVMLARWKQQEQAWPTSPLE